MAKHVVQRYNVSVPKQYTTAPGEQKTQWLNIGSAVQFDDGSIMQTINSLPIGSWWDGTCQLFERKEQQGSTPHVASTQNNGIASPQGNYQPKQVPSDALPF